VKWTRCVLSCVFIRRASLSFCLLLALVVDAPGAETANGPNVAAAPASLGAQTAKPDELSGLLAESIKKHKLPGMVAAIVNGDRVVAIGAAGVRCRGHQEVMTVDDEVHIGSNTKSMTATLIAMLVEDKKLRWDSTPAEIIANHGVKSIDPAWKRVTLEQLLAHRGGVRANPTTLSMLASRFLPDSPRQQRLGVCRAVLAKPPEHEPGKEFLYSNTGYILAGAMAEAVTDQSWEDLMRRRLFVPLGMSSAGFGAPGFSEEQPHKSGSSKAINQPYGHSSGGEPAPPGWDADNPQCLGPAGRVHLSLRDWAKYAALHLAGARGVAYVPPGATKPLLTVESLHRLQTPIGGTLGKQDVRYAMGWVVLTDKKTGETALMHDGSNTMWLAEIVLSPKQNVAFLAATNQGGRAAQAACSEVAKTLSDRTLKPSGSAPR